MIYETFRPIEASSLDLEALRLFVLHVLIDTPGLTLLIGSENPCLGFVKGL